MQEEEKAFLRTLEQGIKQFEQFVDQIFGYITKAKEHLESIEMVMVLLMAPLRSSCSIPIDPDRPDSPTCLRAEVGGGHEGLRSRVAEAEGGVCTRRNRRHHR